MSIPRARTACRLGLAALVTTAAAAAMGPLLHAQSAEDAAAFALTDSNRDGMVDPDEYRNRMVEVFYFSDKNVDGTLVITEISGAAPAEFSAADANGDGKLSQDEFVDHHMSGFSGADKDGDGKLSSQEVGAWKP